METRFQRNLVAIVLSLLYLGFYSVAVSPTADVVSIPIPHLVSTSRIHLVSSSRPHLVSTSRIHLVSSSRPHLVSTSKIHLVSTPRPTDCCEAGEIGDRECRAKNAICIENNEGQYDTLSSALKPYKCVCANGMDFLSGEYCRELITFCEDNRAEVNIIRSGSACRCPFNEFFDYNIFQCQPLDHCPFLNCTGKYEECVGSKCVCKTEYERQDRKCKPIDYCSLSNICGKAKCKRGPDEDPKNVKCYCDNGFLLVRSGSHLRCKSIQCETPAFNACDQTCNYTDDDNIIECGCLPGHQMQSDGITCKSKATNKCDYSICPSSAVCVQMEGTKMCYCKKGFKEDADGSCVNICEASNYTNEICPDGCISTLNGFRCICIGKYRLSSNGITCEERKMCSLDESGYKDCKRKNRTCMERPDIYAGYECGDCLNGLSPFNGICTSLCEVAEYKLYCESRRATCVDVDSQSQKVRCQCPSLLSMDPELGCVFANHSYIVTLDLLNSYEIGNSSEAEDNNLNWKRLKKDVSQSFTAVYGRALSQTNVLVCRQTVLSDLRCQIELQFYLDPFSVKFSDRLANSEVCKETGFTKTGYCFIPPFVIARKISISSMAKSNPCDSVYGGSVCPPSTVCHRKGIGYSCSCKAGYKAIGVVYMTHDGRYPIQICDDIDECLEKPCPARTGCRNIPGDYRCDCLSGYRRSVNNSKTICNKICQRDTCKHGSCNWVDSVGIECKCTDGYAGKYCELLSEKSTEKNTNQQNALLIAFGTIEGILLVLLLVGFIVLFKFYRNRKSSSNAVEMTNNSAPVRGTPHINGIHLANISVPLGPLKTVTQPKIPSNEEFDEPIYVDCGQIPQP